MKKISHPILYIFLCYFLALVVASDEKAWKTSLATPIKKMEEVDAIFVLNGVDSMPKETMAARFVAFQNYLKKTAPDAPKIPIYLSAELAVHIPVSEKSKDQSSKQKTVVPLYNVPVGTYLKMLCQAWGLEYTETTYGVIIK